METHSDKGSNEVPMKKTMTAMVKSVSIVAMTMTQRNDAGDDMVTKGNGATTRAMTQYKDTRTMMTTVLIISSFTTTTLHV